MIVRRLVPAATVRSMLVTLIAIVAVPLVALGAYQIGRNYRDRLVAEADASAELARATAISLEAFVTDVLRAEHAVAVAMVGHEHTPLEIEADLRAIGAEYPALRDMSWMGSDGTIVASTEPLLLGKSFFAREYFQEISRGAVWRVSPLFRSVLDRGPVFVIARGVRTPSGELLGVIAAAVDAERVGAALGPRTRGGWTSVIDSAGTLVAIEPELSGLDWETRRRTSEEPWTAQALSGVEQHGVFHSALDDQTRIGAVVPIPSLGWAARASRPLAEAVSAARRSAAESGLAALGIALAALAVAALLARRIGDPLRELEQHAAELARGAASPLRSRGPVEVRRVARALDAMAGAVAARRTELEEATRRAEVATERAEAHGAELDAIVTALPIGLVVLDREGRVARLNAGAREILGLGELGLPMTITECAERFQATRPDGHPLTLEEQPALRALRGERARGEVLRVERARGDVVWVAVSAAPIGGANGSGRGAVVAILDVTHVRTLQEERETLIHTVSHDLRTPLHVIVTHADLLRRRGNDEARRRGEAILASAARMQRLVEDLVDAARLETGRVQLQLAPVDLGRFLAAWRTRMAGALPVDRVRISSPESPPTVLADPTRLDQILSNLVSNALKYSVEGTKVDVELATAPGALRLSVRDGGPGIAPEDLSRVFDRYWRAKTAAHAEGLGLGLFITRRLVEAHGWRIEVASELGRGSVFTVVVPMGAARSPRARDTAA